MRNRYEVIVGNIGLIYEGGNGNRARRQFNEYVRISLENYGRAAGESVTLFMNDEPIKEYIGARDWPVLVKREQRKGVDA